MLGNMLGKKNTKVKESKKLLDKAVDDSLKKYVDERIAVLNERVDILDQKLAVILRGKE